MAQRCRWAGFSGSSRNDDYDESKISESVTSLQPDALNYVAITCLIPTRPSFPQ
jgi:hypothetical protein